MKTCLLCGMLLVPFTPALADKSLQSVACRSVHLAYDAGASTAFYLEASVEQSAAGTYFCVCGFDRGYFGIQELGNKKKLVIFSVWDPTKGDDPKAVAAEQRVKEIYKDEKVRTGRFGGEGTGGQSFFDYDWKVGQTYRFLVTARVDGDRTEYAGWFFVPEEKAWKHLVTFSTLSKGRLLDGHYSFVEDFRRNKISATEVRKARFGGGWVLAKDGKWSPLLKAQFTADGNPVTNIDAGIAADAADRFYLATGGATANTGTPLWKHITLAKPASQPPEDVVKLLAE